MNHLTELALINYQNNLTMIDRLYRLGGMNTEEYLASKETAARLWSIDQRIIAMLETRKNLIGEV